MWREGFTVGLTDGDRLLVRPASTLSAGQREMLLAFKPELIAYLQAAHRTTAALLVAASRVCDLYGDGPAARAEMERDCLATPPHLQPDLLQHLKGQA